MARAVLWASAHMRRSAGTSRTADRGRTFASPAGRLFAVIGILTATGLHCGARTGLPIPEIDEEPPPFEPEACTTFKAYGELAPLDIHIMLDSSGSMNESAGVASKWASVASALGLFYDDVGSTGLGVSLSYFPQVDPFIAAECFGDPLLCGEPDACTTQNFCEASGLGCATAADCDLQGAVGEACVPIGFCQGHPQVACAAGTPLDCPSGDGPCIEYGYCENHYKCDVESYQIPDVFIDELPDAAEPLKESLANRFPGGLTPTRPALEGALAQAMLSVEERKRKAIIVLGTDGFPTACEPALEESIFAPEIITNVADIAQEGVDVGIQTFVIGVFTEEEAEEAQQNLDLIAIAGGTEEAFIITTNALTQDFAAALTEVRVAATACEYAIPSENAATEWAKAHVFVKPDVQTPEMELSQLDSGSKCAGESLAFYVSTGADGAPRLVLCPSTCSFLGNVETHPLEVRIGGCAGSSSPAPP
jgi:hypothetical protein